VLGSGLPREYAFADQASAHVVAKSDKHLADPVAARYFLSAPSLHLLLVERRGHCNDTMF
jgi:hypothetical protein